VIFAFVVRKLRWLAKMPGAPQVFDAALLLSTAMLHPRRLRAISTIEKDAQQFPGVTVGVHRFGGIGFFLGGKELSHIHGNGLLDCFVGRANRERLVRKGSAVVHHVFPRTGWVSFFVKGPEEVAQALELIQIAYAYRESAE
jgi:hypothetical protein